MILGLATVANADLLIGVYETDGTTAYDGRILNESDYLELKVVSGDSTTTYTTGFAMIADTTLGTIGSTGTTTTLAPDASMLLGSASYNGVYNMPANYDGIVGIVDGYTSSGPFAQGDFFEDISFHCEGSDDVVVYLYEITNSWDINERLIDSVTIHQVPEPMTLSLLGLGGLGLLRRRR
jgi:hypothetical protein